MLDYTRHCSFSTFAISGTDFTEYRTFAFCYETGRMRRWPFLASPSLQLS